MVPPHWQMVEPESAGRQTGEIGRKWMTINLTGMKTSIPMVSGGMRAG